MLTAYGKKFSYDGFIAALKKANDSYHHIPLMQLIKKEDQYPSCLNRNDPFRPNAR